MYNKLIISTSSLALDTARRLAWLQAVSMAGISSSNLSLAGPTFCTEACYAHHLVLLGLSNGDDVACSCSRMGEATKVPITFVDHLT